ncbi:MAG: glycosyltransferase family 2 protein [Melioribacteraceae bacterium]|nr:glycosyltransferase family 2 protein [Melioribacteraceae bacterium]
MISSITIAKNEENNIKRCLNSLMDCIDEIIVLVDSKSTDNTFPLVQSYGDKVKCIKTDWKGYSQTKQEAVSYCTNNWILWIDADEAVTPELSVELNQLKNDKKEFSVYSIPRKAYFLGKWIKNSGWYPGRVERLFDKNKVKFSDSNVHEHLIYEGISGKLNSDLEHYTDPNIHHYFEKLNRYTTLAAEELKTKKEKASINDLFLRPVFIFVKMFILRQGYRDGIHGFILAVFSSMYVFVKYAKLWEIKNNKSNK